MIYTKQKMIAMGKEKILEEAEALKRVAEQVDDSYAMAIQAILECEGRLIITGLGKTGHVASKLAATFASLGTPAFLYTAASHFTVIWE
ncbi:MAG: SIS domain-containing protein [Lachnospiraceae bacterium]